MPLEPVVALDEVTAGAKDESVTSIEKAALIIGNFLPPSISSVGVCKGLADRLASHNWKVLTASDLTSKPRRILDMVTTVWNSRDQYAVAHVDIYSGPAFIWAEAACWALRRARKPYVLTLHGGNLPGFSRRWPRRVTRLLCRAFAVTTPSRYLRDAMKTYREDIMIIPNSIDLRACEFRLRRQARPRLVWLRAFHEIYNPSLAAAVVAELAGDVPGLHLSMIGPDKGDGSLERMKSLAEQLGVSNIIKVVGPKPKEEIAKWLTQGDVFINTTDVDNTPISLLEAMACGLCVVSTNVGGIPFIIEDGKNGLLVEPNNPKLMAAAAKRILADATLAMSLSQKARETAEQYDWSRVMPRWEELLIAAQKEGSK